MICAGIDIGSNTSKAALLKDRQLLTVCVQKTGYDHVQAGAQVFDSALKASGLQPGAVSSIVATGYGRASLDFADKALTEIICHGAGAFFMNPEIRGVIDAGGQDSKAVLLDAGGKAADFSMNDKCAAGTGRFLEVMANALDVDLDRMGEFGLSASSPSKISSICTVFAESEVISMIARRQKREDIIAGIHDSAAARVAILARKIKLKAPVMMTGGVAKNKGMVQALERRLGFELLIGDYPQENGAIGAAVLASQL